MCRHELKYVLRDQDAPFIERWLWGRCRPDAAHPANRVSSIYFDTSEWSFLREKVNGDYLKTKVRVRWYETLPRGGPSDESFVEVKRKVGARREKIRVRIDVPGAWLRAVSLDAAALLSVPDVLRREGVPLPEPLFPTFQVRYRRHRFVEPLTGARISVDGDIETPSWSRRMLGGARPRGRLRQAVIEVKSSTATLPETLRGLTDLGARKCAFSKYSECYRSFTGGSL